MNVKRLIMRKLRVKFRRQHGPEPRRSLGDKWRRPKGIDSKKRIERKDKGPVVKIGYRTPRVIRGLHPSGYPEVIVYNPWELEGLSGVVVRIARTVGARKRAQILEKAKELGLKVVNP